MQSYRPSNRVHPSGLLLLLGVVLIGGVVLGLLTYYISEVIYLVFAMPVIIGLAVGKITAWIVRLGKVRFPLLAGIAAILFGLVLYGTYRYAEYRIGFRGDLNDTLKEETGRSFSDDELQFWEDRVLDSEIGQTGFTGYTRLYAREGFSITRAGSGSDSGGLVIKGIFAYLYWLIEIGLISVFGYRDATDAAREPFSEATDEWFGAPAVLGSLTFINAQHFLAAATAGDFPTAAALVEPFDLATLPRFDAAVHRASRADAPALLAVYKHVAGRSGSVTSLLRHGVITPDALRTLESGIAHAQQAHAPGSAQAPSGSEQAPVS